MNLDPVLDLFAPVPDLTQRGVASLDHLRGAVPEFLRHRLEASSLCAPNSHHHGKLRHDVNRQHQGQDSEA